MMIRQISLQLQIK